VLIGRNSDGKGGVDVDLANEIAAGKVSRNQAYLSLQPDGAFHLENIGRQSMHVDGIHVAPASGTTVQHLSLIEVGGVRLLLIINSEAVERILRRSGRLVV
jgi:hypothetical protein